MKRAFALLFILALVLAMSGCTLPGINKSSPGEDNMNSTEGGGPSVTATPTAGATAAVIQTTPLPITVPGTSVSNSSQLEAGKYNGTWDTSYGMMTFTVNGNHVSGVYDYKNGTIDATLSADGRSMEGMWYEEPTRLSPDNAGKVVFNISDDGKAISGKWWYGQDANGGTWDGIRVSNTGTGF